MLKPQYGDMESAGHDNAQLRNSGVQLDGGGGGTGAGAGAAGPVFLPSTELDELLAADEEDVTNPGGAGAGAGAGAAAGAGPVFPCVEEDETLATLDIPTLVCVQ
jgi:hypothetical protein